jgi:hypothetical protein
MTAATSATTIRPNIFNQPIEATSQFFDRKNTTLTRVDAASTGKTALKAPEMR